MIMANGDHPGHTLDSGTIQWRSRFASFSSKKKDLFAFVHDVGDRHIFFMTERGMLRFPRLFFLILKRFILSAKNQKSLSVFLSRRLAGATVVDDSLPEDGVADTNANIEL